MVWTDAPGADALRRTAMVVVGFVLALVSLTIGSFALAQVWLAPAAALDAVPASGTQSWESLAMILAYHGHWSPQVIFGSELDIEFVEGRRIYKS